MNTATKLAIVIRIEESLSSIRDELIAYKKLAPLSAEKKLLDLATRSVNLLDTTMTNLETEDRKQLNWENNSRFGTGLLRAVVQDETGTRRRTLTVSRPDDKCGQPYISISMYYSALKLTGAKRLSTTEKYTIAVFDNGRVIEQIDPVA